MVGNRTLGRSCQTRAQRATRTGGLFRRRLSFSGTMRRVNSNPKLVSTSKLINRDAIVRCILGTAVGDAIGLPCEGLSLKRPERFWNGQGDRRSAICISSPSYFFTTSGDSLPHTVDHQPPARPQSGAEKQSNFAATVQSFASAPPLLNTIGRAGDRATRISTTDPSDALPRPRRRPRGGCGAGEVREWLEPPRRPIPLVAGGLKICDSRGFLVACRIHRHLAKPCRPLK